MFGPAGTALTVSPPSTKIMPLDADGDVKWLLPLMGSPASAFPVPASYWYSVPPPALTAQTPPPTTIGGLSDAWLVLCQPRVKLLFEAAICTA